MTTKSARDLRPGDRIPFMIGAATFRTIEHVEVRRGTVLIYAGSSDIPLRLAATAKILVELIQ